MVMVAEAEGRVALISPGEIALACERLRGVALRTPLLPAPELSEALGGEVRLKCESLQRGGAFKIRGAFNFLSRLDPADLDRGVVAYSSGNHALGVALAARLLNARAVVVMPVTAPAIKQEGARRLGAEVVLHGHTSLERRRRAEGIALATGRTLVPGFDDRRIMAGQATIGVEIAEEWPEVENVVVPCGGGGMLGGIAAAMQWRLPRVRTVGVEPVAAPSMTAALAAGEPVLLPRTRTIADGIAAVRVSDLTLAHALELVSEVVTVEEDAIRDAAVWLFLREKLVAEFSGAAGVAALLSGRVRAAGARTAVVISGGNMDPSVMSDLFGNPEDMAA